GGGGGGGDRAARLALRGPPLAAELPREVQMEAACEREDERHDVSADRVVVDLAEVGDDDGVRDERRCVVARRRRRLRRLQPAQSPGLGEQRVRQRAEGGVRIGDGSRDIRVGLGDDDRQAGNGLLQALRPLTGLVGLRREHEQGGWHGGSIVYRLFTYHPPVPRDLRAVASVKIDNERVRVTEWRFAPGTSTGPHRHELAYVVVPLTTGR